MFCTQCGSNFSSTENVCGQCGAARLKTCSKSSLPTKVEHAEGKIFGVAMKKSSLSEAGQQSLSFLKEKNLDGPCKKRKITTMAKSEETTVRIERWWGYLRQSLSDFWIHQFKTMESEGHIDRKCKLHILCIQFVFLPIIQKSLHDLIVLWNSHTIRNQNIGDVISGIPEVLFKNPELEGTEDFKIPVSEDNLRRLHILNQNFTELDQDFVQIAHDVLNYYDLPESVSNFEDAKHLYTVLKESITSLLLQ